MAAAQLDQVAQRAAAEGWSYSHFAAVLIEGEIAERRAERARLNLRFANFPYLKRLDDFDYAAQPGIDPPRARGGSIPDDQLWLIS